MRPSRDHSVTIKKVKGPLLLFDSDMGLLDVFKKKPAVPDIDGFSCSTIALEDCSGCEIQYPKTFSVEDSTPIWNTAPPCSLQILVSTGRQDWKRSPADDSGPYVGVFNALDGASSKFSDIVGGPVRINATNEDIEGDTIRVTVIPQFIYVDTTKDRCVEDVLKILRVKETSDYTPDVGTKMHDKGIIMLCSHKTRDKRCGISAPLMRDALNMELRDAGLYRDYGDDSPGGVKIVFVNHVGGHKFAANCFYYSRDGSAVLMALVRPEHAKPIVEKTIQQGIVFKDLLRNCSKNTAFEW